MKKIYLFLLCVSVFAISANAQVTIGSQDAPAEGALLELKSSNLGFLPPRVALTSLSDFAPLPGSPVDGMVVFNTTLNLDANLQPGLYYNQDGRWVRLYTSSSAIKESWLYMPSIVFDTSTPTPAGSSLTKDLYLHFKEQLNDVSNTNTSTSIIPSDGAPTQALASVPGPEDLYYYVTAHDPNVFEILSISATGVLTYRVLAPGTDETILNIVFVEK